MAAATDRPDVTWQLAARLAARLALILPLPAAAPAPPGATQAAAPPALDEAGLYDGCIRRSGGVTAAMRDCAEQEFARLDRKLNQTCRAAMERLPDAAARARLRGLQRAWLRERRTVCDRRVAGSEQADGTAALLLLDDCWLEQMTRRIAWLEAYPDTH